MKEGTDRGISDMGGGCRWLLERMEIGIAYSARAKCPSETAEAKMAITIESPARQVRQNAYVKHGLCKAGSLRSLT